MSRGNESCQPTQKTVQHAPAFRLLESARKRYRAPRLKVYGRLAELTRFGGSLAEDSGMTGSLGNLTGP